jgi:hypothetical protein
MSLFANLDTKTSKAAPSELAAKAQPKKFSPGQYEVQIIDVKEPRPSRRDSTWLSYMVVFKDVGGERKGSVEVLVPTASLTFHGDTRGVNEMKIRSFLESLGFQGTQETIASDLRQLFDNPSKGLVGKRMTCVLDYRSVHTKWNREEKKVQLFDAQGNAMRDAAGEPVLFDSSDEAALWCKENKHYFNDFVTVVKYIPSKQNVTTKKRTSL